MSIQGIGAGPGAAQGLQQKKSKGPQQQPPQPPIPPNNSAPQTGSATLGLDTKA